MLVSWGTQVKGSLAKANVKDCFTEADTGERMFGYSKHVKECLMEYKYDPTDSGRIGLFCSALLFFTKDSLVYLT